MTLGLMSFNVLNRFGWNVPHLARSLQSRAVLRPAPPPRDTQGITTPNEFLKAIGRSSETKLGADTWAGLWKTSGREMKKAGLSVKDRRYILWCMEKYRLGFGVEKFAHEARRRKTVRGWR